MKKDICTNRLLCEKFLFLPGNQCEFEIITDYGGQATSTCYKVYYNNSGIRLTFNLVTYVLLNKHTFDMHFSEIAYHRNKILNQLISD